MSDRGDYRSLYSAFWDDPDVHALSDASYRVLTTLKGTLPASGIGVVYRAVLAERTNKTAAELETAFQDLERPKLNSDFGWIVRERNIVWIVNGLRFEPTLSSTNSKHRTFLRDRLLAPLGERTAIVASFRRYYAEWFEDAAPTPNTPPNARPVSPSSPVPSGTKNGRQSDGHTNPIDRVSKHNSNSNSNSSPSQSGTNSKPDDNDRARSPEAPVDPEPSALDDPLSALSLVRLANASVTARWGEQTSPYPTNGHATHLSESLKRNGVSPDAAARSVQRQCESLTTDRPPRTIKYFEQGILDDWIAETAPALAGRPGKGAKIGPGERTYHNATAALEGL